VFAFVLWLKPILFTSRQRDKRTTSIKLPGDNHGKHHHGQDIATEEDGITLLQYPVHADVFEDY
jgi:hypothetical protein